MTASPAPRPPITQNPDIRFLGALLGDVIRAYGGEKLFHQTEYIRAASVDRHRGIGDAAMVGGFCSAAMADEIDTLLRPRFAGQTGGLEMERTIERVRACGVLKDARGAEISAELAKIR